MLLVMKSKHDLVNEIFDNMEDYFYKSPKNNIVNLVVKYKDYELVEDVHRHVFSGMIMPHEAMEFLSGIKPIKKVTYAF